MTPEEKARHKIDTMLAASDWVVQTKDRINLSAAGRDIPWVSSGDVCFRPIVDTREGLENSSTRLNPQSAVLLGMIGEGKTSGQTGIPRIDACNNQNCADNGVSQAQVPSFAEQTRIVAEEERRMSVVVELEVAVSTKLRRAVRLRQFVLQKAFTGKLY